jgi:hypothetical protein
VKGTDGDGLDTEPTPDRHRPSAAEPERRGTGGPDLPVLQYLREIGTNARRKRRTRKCYGLSDRSYVRHFTLQEKREASGGTTSSEFIVFLH